jgi:hypothetical protein
MERFFKRISFLHLRYIGCRITGSHRMKLEDQCKVVFTDYSNQLLLSSQVTTKYRSWNTGWGRGRWRCVRYMQVTSVKVIQRRLCIGLLYPPWSRNTPRNGTVRLPVVRCRIACSPKFKWAVKFLLFKKICRWSSKNTLNDFLFVKNVHSFVEKTKQNRYRKMPIFRTCTLISDKSGGFAAFLPREQWRVQYKK